MNTKRKGRFCSISLLMLIVMQLSSNLFGDSRKEKPDYSITIPIFGNSCLLNDPMRSDELITETGISNWKNDDDRFRTYFYLEKTGVIHLAFKARVTSGKSILKTTFDQ